MSNALLEGDADRLSNEDPVHTYCSLGMHICKLKVDSLNVWQFHMQTNARY